MVGTSNIYSTLRKLESEGAATILDEIEGAKVGIKTVKHAKLAKPADEVYEFFPEVENSAPKQLVILMELLSLKGEEVPQAELLSKTNSNQSSVKSLEQKGLVEVFDKEIERRYTETYNEDIKTFKLTEPQKEIIDVVCADINEGKFNPYLLHGVTGSGKTQVYIELAKTALKKKKSVLILVPEISLTPQITSRFLNEFGDIITMMHSRMSLGERFDSWRGMVKGKFKIVIGPRSALFAPIKNIGLIVVDEEHDSSYKQYDMVPKYHARDSAVMLAQFNNAPVLLGSATPSIESKHNANTGKYKLLELKERVDNAKLPVIRLVDVKIESKQKRMESIFSKTLLDAIAERLRKKEGVIILQNRRGFATQVFCEDCGEIEMCPNCSVSMVHHLHKNMIQCHYCGMIKRVPKACSVCGSLSIKFFGTGTQKVEDELDYYFPNVKIERVDSDSIQRKGRLGVILNQFRKGEIDILVGTQMVSKGLDFSQVTLVGVISAETTLWLPDFRADERTFQLLTQVSGRAGRSSIEGEVLIQTQDHRNFVLQKVLMNDYPGFFSKEIVLREKSGYPPFTRLCLIEAKDLKEEKARGAVNDIFKFLSKYKKGLNVNQPTPAVIERIKGFYRHQILIKSYRDVDPSGRYLRDAVLNAYIEFNQKSRYRDVRVSIDVDPQSVI